MDSSESISSAAILDVIDRLKGQCYRKLMCRSYYSAWKSFNSFYVRLDVKPSTWEQRITLFVGYLIDNKRKSATFKSCVSTEGYLSRTGC